MPAVNRHRSSHPSILSFRPLPFHRHLLARAIVAALVGTSAFTSAVSAQEVAAEQKVVAARSYDIPAGPLTDSLNRFGREAGILLSFSTDLTNDLHSPRLTGSYSVEAGFEQLLAASGLEAVRQPNGSYVLQRAAQQGETLLLPVPVTARFERVSVQDEGGADAGYRSRTVSALGPLGRMDLQDTPFSVSVISQELMQNMLAQSPDDLYKLNPSTRTMAPQVAGWSPMVTIRGFNSYDTAEDGLRRAYNHAAIIEDKGRVEILNGLSGFLFGAASPGGMVNYVYKRPTQERLNSVAVGNYGGSQYFVHGDFGGRIDEEGRIGYRLNVVRQDGETAIEDQKIDRKLVSGAFDWQLTDQLLFELNAVYNNYRTEGASAYWYYDVPHGAAPDADKLWSQPWIADEFDNKKVMGKLTYQLNEHIALRGAYMRDFIDRPHQDHTMNNVISATEFTQIRIRSGETRDVYNAGQLLADFDFETGPLKHRLTAGYYMYSDESWTSTYSPNTGWLGPYPLNAPTYVPEPEFPVDDSSLYNAGFVRNENYVIGDTIAFNSQWSMLLGINHSRISTKFLDSDGSRSQPDYDEGRNSPSASLIYKPVEWLTSYASYIEGLEQGGIAPEEADNYREILAPMVSKQREIGVKADAGGMLLTAALFEIEKAYEYTDSNRIYRQNGRQNHRGFEVSGTGKLTDRITLIGGATWLDAKVHKGDNDGKEPINVAEFVAKLYSEYELPFVPDLSLTAGIYYTGKQWANDANGDRLPGFTTVDIGARYSMEIGSDRELTLRAGVNNIADKNYWLNSYYVGAPRTVAFSAQLQF